MITTFRSAIALLLMFTLGSGSVWGQVYSGTYYIKSASTCKNPSGDYYLCPTEDWAFFYDTNNVNGTNNGQPFLTTHIIDSGDEAKYIWIVEKHTKDNHDYYAFKHNIKHEGVSRYLSYNRKLTGDGVGVDRMRIHLKKTETPGDYELFDIAPKEGTTYFVIMPKLGDEDESNTRKYLVVNGGNTNYYKGYYIKGGGVKEKKNGPSGFENTTGVIGTYSALADDNNPFVFEKVRCITPVISFDNVTSEVTITSDDDETIYYTTDGSDPDENSDEYSAPFELTEGAVINAISKKDGIIDSEIATLTVEKLATPTITFNEETREATITAAEGADIYYTINDTDPTIEETTAHAASPIIISHALPSTKIHARAVKSGSIHSDVAAKTDIPIRVLTTPTIILTEDEFVYDGSAKEPVITVKDEDVVVSADEYVVNYSNNTNAGTASVTVSDQTAGDYQVNGLTQTFTISPKSLGDGNIPADGIAIVLNSSGELSAVKDGDTSLTDNIDYTYLTETDGNDQIVTVSGIGNYKDSAKGLYATPVFKDPNSSGVAAAVYNAKRDITSPSGIIPYIVRKVNPTIGTLTISPIGYIPQDVPVLLLSDTEAEGFTASLKDSSTPVITDTEKSSNLLMIAPEGGVDVKDTEAYIFYRGEFVLTKKGTIKESSFFIYNPNYNANLEQNGQNGNAPCMTLHIVIDNSTGIDEIMDDANKGTRDDSWFTLDGRRLSNKPTQKGLYISNNRKVFIK